MLIKNVCTFALFIYILGSSLFIYAQESSTILQAHLASLEALESYDVVVHKATEKRTKTKGAEVVKSYEEEHYRVVKVVGEKWAVNATIKVADAPTKIDLKKLRPSPNPSQVTEVSYFHSNVTRVQSLGGNSSNPAIKDFWGFQNACMDYPPIEFTCVGVGAWQSGMDRHTFIDQQIASFAGMKPVKTLGDEVILAFPSAKTYVLLSTYTMNRITQTPVSMHVFNNPGYSGDMKSLPHNNHFDFEYKVINDISLPVKKTVNGSFDEAIDGQQVHTELTQKTEIKWLKVNEQLEFPDVDLIARNYSNLYEYIFQEKP